MLFSLSSPQNTLRKRASQALGSLTWSISPKYFASVLAYLLSRLRNATIFVRAGATTTETGEQLEALVSNHALLQRPRLTTQLKQSATVDMVKTLLQCLNMVGRHMLRAPNQLRPVLRLLTIILRQPGSCDSDMDDVHELAIQTLETLVRFCPRVLLPMLPELTSLLCERLTYDPNYDSSEPDDDGDRMAVDDGDADLDFEDGDDGDDDYSDDEDSSWKVRRAAARALEAIILTYPEKTSEFYVSIAPLLIKRFNDREEPVRFNIFSCFGALLRQTRINLSASTALGAAADSSVPVFRPNDGFPQRTATLNAITQSSVMELQSQLKDPTSPPSRLLALLPTVCRSIQRQASLSLRRKCRSAAPVTSRGAPGIQHAAFMLNRDLALALPGHLGDQLSEILSLVHAYSLDPSTSNTVKVDMIDLVVLLLSTHSPDYFRPNLEILLQLAVWAMKDPFYRVALEGLELTQLLSTQLRSLGQESQVMIPFAPLAALLEANDRDLELKEKAIASAAVFIGQVGDLIGPSLDKCLEVIYCRLKSELTRLSAVRAIHIIAISKIPLKLDTFLPRASDELATLLSQSDRVLRLTTVRCLYTIWCKHPQLVGAKCLNTVLDLVPRLLSSEQDLQTAQLIIHLISLLLESSVSGPSDQRVSQFISSDHFIQPLIGLAHSPLLRGQALEAMLRLMRAIGKHARTNEQDHMLITLFLSRLLGPLNGGGLLIDSFSPPAISSATLHRDALPSLAQCIAELLAELPTSPMAKIVPGSVSSVNVAVDRLIAAVQNSNSSSAEVFLDLLILGELGRKLDLSNRLDLREIFLSCLSAQTFVPLSEDQSASPRSATTGSTLAEQVKPAAALGLGRLVVGQPETLLPFLVDRISEVATGYLGGGGCAGSPASMLTARSGPQQQQHLYHLLQALKEVLINLAGFNTTNALRTHLDAIWSLLIASSGLPEEGTRSIVAECLGRLILVSPRQLINRLRQQLNSPEASSSPLVRCTLVSAVKFILIVTDLDATAQAQLIGQTRLEHMDWPSGQGTIPLSSDPSVSTTVTSEAFSTVLTEVDTVLRSDPPAQPLLDFLSRLADPDILVRRATLSVLNTAVHHRPSLVRPLLNVPIDAADPHSPTVLKLLYAETAVRPELIREVEMGPFKHKEDDGLDLRKYAFECMSTLLETCLDKLVVAEFLEPLIEGLKDHTDIKLLSYQMLQQISCIRPLEISAKMDALAAPLKTVLLSKPKEDWVKQEMEKMQELSRCAICLIARFKSIDDIDKNRSYSDLVRTIEADPSLKAIYMTVLANGPDSSPVAYPPYRRNVQPSTVTYVV
ncbi:Cullin-associated NEDD8-dissociated protein 1 [Paragonimus heterotremus]|uniref:Cullin-associated NEDD8-dissociated protein 1 n=1 Tax=Paragonimus heterotremus TaxID=100268 RepID=A0A8J4WJ45_9TREM|nr:Cullin-associated NEDD8-dissociated protein 1 [Paragonimus heterotremus]